MEALKPFFDSLVGKRIAGRYLVDRLLGTGGMGLVAAARYPELGQKVAIKFLRPELAADTVVSARFMREARVAAKVKSAHFVRVFDVGRLESGVPYLVMEMLTGRDMGDELRERGPLPFAEAVDCILQACAGVAELHALGIVHRDLKPSNLFVANVAGTSILKVLDFGISKEQKSESLAPLTATDHVLGTPQYMSPEQVKASKDVDFRSDIWSLGVILYELVTQSIPFPSEGGGVGEMFAKILYVDPDPPRARRPDLPEALEAVIMRCMARDKAARYASVTELAEALRPFAAENAQHRVEAVKLAASVPPAEVDDDPILEVEERDAGEDSHAVTKESSPNAKREAMVFAPTAPASSRSLGMDGGDKSVPAAQEVMTAHSLVTSAKTSEKPQGRSSKLLIVAVVGVVAIGAVAGLIASRSEAANTTTTTTGTPSASAEPPASASAMASATASAAATPSIVPSAAAEAARAFEAVTAPSSVSSAVAKPRPPVTVGARPPARPGSGVAAPRGSAPALILDRK